MYNIQCTVVIIIFMNILHEYVPVQNVEFKFNVDAKLIFMLNTKNVRKVQSLTICTVSSIQNLKI